MNAFQLNAAEDRNVRVNTHQSRNLNDSTNRLLETYLPIPSNVSIVGHRVHGWTWSAQVRKARRNEGVCARDVDVLGCGVNPLALQMVGERIGTCCAENKAEFQKHLGDCRPA